MEDLWFEEELIPSEGTVEQTIKSSKRDNQNSEIKDQEVRNTARGILRVDRPRWRELNNEQQLLKSGVAACFYLVRLGFQFDVPQDSRDKGARFLRARCSAYLWPDEKGQPQPIVYEVIPRSLYEGEPRRVSVKIGPELKLGVVEGSLGEVSTDVTVGFVEPVVVGWPGKDERAPYWDLRPQNQTLLGGRHLWLVIEVPLGCSGVRLAAKAEAEVQTYLGPFRLGPRSHEWAERPTVVIK
jgi:hypothetical protein